MVELFYVTGNVRYMFVFDPFSTSLNRSRITGKFGGGGVSIFYVSYRRVTLTAGVPFHG